MNTYYHNYLYGHKSSCRVLKLITIVVLRKYCNSPPPLRLEPLVNTKYTPMTVTMTVTCNDRTLKLLSSILS